MTDDLVDIFIFILK